MTHTTPSTSCAAACPCKYAPWLPRIAFGLILLSYGVNHYRNFEGFSGMAKGVFQIPEISSIAGLLAYIVPALMIIGGALFAIKQLCCISKICILASLSGIIAWASVAVMLGDGNTGGDAMPMIQNAVILILFYVLIQKMSCCGGACSTRKK
jgi:uncharacterized membrane protein YphA (DoxX/SURF4 family)